MLITNQVWIDDDLHHIENINQFYIDANGNKHINQLEKDWQLLDCQYEDELIHDQSGWRVKNRQDRLQDDQKETIKSIQALAKVFRTKLTRHADPYQLISWFDKFQRAQRVLNRTASDADLAILKAECAARGKGETPDQLAQQQATKSEALAIALATIDGIETSAIKAIAKQKTESAITALLHDLKKQFEKISKDHESD